MMKIKTTANKYLQSGFSVIPLLDDKRPQRKWKSFQENKMTPDELNSQFNFYSKKLGVVTGKVSGNLEVIDVDCKYDLTGDLWNNLWTKINPELAKKLVVSETVNNGYHIYYRCPVIEGNQKLSARYTTEEERISEPLQKVKVLVETRGEGGYIVAPPSNGYRFIFGNMKTVKEITPEERSEIFKICRAFNEVEIPAKPIYQNSSHHKSDYTGPNPFENYNREGDVLGLLQSKGWELVQERGETILLSRPGSKTKTVSASYHTDLRTFYCFSTSTEFESEKGYNPVGVFSTVNQVFDKKQLYRMLL